MRIFLGAVCGVIGLLAGWIGSAAATITLWGLGNDGGVGMAAFFQVGPIGGVVGFIAGALLYATFARPRARAAASDL